MTYHASRKLRSESYTLVLSSIACIKCIFDKTFYSMKARTAETMRFNLPLSDSVLSIHNAIS